MLDIYFKPGTVPGAEKTVANKSKSHPHSTYIPVGRQTVPKQKLSM